MLQGPAPPSCSSSILTIPSLTLDFSATPKHQQFPQHPRLCLPPCLEAFQWPGEPFPTQATLICLSTQFLSFSKAMSPSHAGVGTLLHRPAALWQCPTPSPHDLPALWVWQDSEDKNCMSRVHFYVPTAHRGLINICHVNA